MKSGSFSIITGTAMLVLAAMAHGAEPAAPAAPAAPVAPAGDKPPVSAPAAPAEGPVSEMRAKQMKITNEMREISQKLRPVYERLQEDAELKAAVANLRSVQEAVNKLRDAKMRVDPEAALLLDRMDVLRKELVGPGMLPGSRPGPDGMARPMPPQGLVPPAAPPAAPPAVPAAPKAP